MPCICEFQKWIQRLRPYCVNTAPASQQRSSALKELRSLTVEVMDAQKVSTKLLPHPYCILNLKNPSQNPIKVCRTQVQETANPVWEEKFILEWVDVWFLLAPFLYGEGIKCCEMKLKSRLGQGDRLGMHWLGWGWESVIKYKVPYTVLVYHRPEFFQQGAESVVAWGSVLRQ